MVCTSPKSCIHVSSDVFNHVTEPSCTTDVETAVHLGAREVLTTIHNQAADVDFVPDLQEEDVDADDVWEDDFEGNKKRKQRKKAKLCKRQKWSTEEVDELFELFEDDFRVNVVPNPKRLKAAIKNSKFLCERKPVLITKKLSNMMKKRRQ